MSEEEPLIITKIYRPPSRGIVDIDELVFHHNIDIEEETSELVGQRNELEG